MSRGRTWALVEVDSAIGQLIVAAGCVRWLEPAFEQSQQNVVTVPDNIRSSGIADRQGFIRDWADLTTEANPC